MKTVLLTRPEQNALSSIERLHQLGYKALNCPLIKTERVLFDTNIQTVNIIVTSQNGVEYGLRYLSSLDKHVFAVGAQTARKAKELGFKKITIGKGNGADLAQDIIKQYKHSDISGTFTHLTGSEIAFDIAHELNNAGIEAKRRVTYKTSAMNMLPETVLSAIKNGEINHILFYSAQTATIFEQMMHKTRHIDALQNITAMSLSKRIDYHLKGPWQKKRIATKPSEDYLFEMLKW